MAKGKAALGRGLDALFGEIDEAYDNEGSSSKNGVLEIPLNQIKANPFQPRKSFDEKSLQELSESIKEYGIIQPIVVVEEEFDQYTLVAGERRFRASKLAKLKTIKAVIVNLDQEQMRQHALIENIQRDELNAIELAKAYDELIKVHDITHEELSSIVFKSRTHISNTLRLLLLNKKSQKALLEGRISAGHAKMLVTLNEKDQSVMVDSIIGQKLSVRDVEKMAKNLKNGDVAAKMVSKKSPVLDFEMMKNRLESFDLKVNYGSNKVTFEFENDTQIADFLQILR